MSKPFLRGGANRGSSPSASSSPLRADDPVAALRGESYVNLVTFKRDGSGVKTPVWFAHLEDGRLGIFTNGKSYKVKRLARDTRVQVAACDMRGKLRGPWYDGSGQLVEDPDLDQKVYAALRKKYGLQMWIAAVGGKISGRQKDWKTIVVSLV